jgi:hypothetical protein
MSMTSIRVVAAASLGALLCGQSLVAQAPFQYREYALASSVASVVKTSNAREDGVKTLHERPARIQEVEWRAPYARSGDTLADPVRDVLFSFYDDQLYQVVVTYDRERMEGLTNADVIESISTTYGLALLRHGRLAQNGLPAETTTVTAVVAQWEDAASLLTLTRGSYSAQYQLVLTSKTLTPLALVAIKDALRLDTQDAPQRERDQRTKDMAAARVASQKARVVNKAAFKP